MKKLVVLATLFIFFCLGGQTVQAQDYDASLGIRLGGGTGITYKSHLSGNMAFEGLLYMNPFNYGGLLGVGLAEWHFPLGRSDWNWFAGAGGHVALFGNTGFGIGVDGIIGLEYTFRDIPVTFQFDYKPAINLTNEWNDYSNVALSIRYVF